MTMATVPHRMSTSPVNRLQREFAAVRVSSTWLGVRKTLTPGQKAEAADNFGAQHQYLSATKKLLDTSDASYRIVASQRSMAVAFWKSMSLPYPEPGIRLIRQQNVEHFHRTMTEYRDELRRAVDYLDRHFAEIKEASRQRLGRLYCESDYPASLRGLFDITWEYPAVTPPDYLRQLSPELYEEERARVNARFEEAVTLAEQAFITEFSRLVTHLTERLAASPDGQQKVFRDSAVENLQAFFERFRTLNVRSNSQLDDLVATAQRVIGGVQPQDLRDNQQLRQQIASGFAGLGATLEGMLVDRPRRTILRGPRENSAEAM